MPVCAQYSASGPMVKNFPKQIYNGGTQTWDICEGDNGLIFFANNDGLLLFDGKSFSKFPLPGKTILRSIYFDKISNDGELLYLLGFDSSMTIYKDLVIKKHNYDDYNNYDGSRDDDY
jgi:hypothetical protein